jgi:hypothetical protein
MGGSPVPQLEVELSSGRSWANPRIAYTSVHREKVLHNFKLTTFQVLKTEATSSSQKSLQRNKMAQRNFFVNPEPLVFCKLSYFHMTFSEKSMGELLLCQNDVNVLHARSGYITFSSPVLDP